MNDKNRHSPQDIGLPPDVFAALVHESAEEQAELVEAWNLAGYALSPEPTDADFRNLGVEIWHNLEAALQQEAKPQETTPLRLVKAPLRLVSIHTLRWAAMAACLALLLSVGVLLYQQPVTVTAPYGDIASIDLPDGSHVELNSGSTLQYPRHFGGDARDVQLTGEAFFSVEKGSVPFVVETFNGATTVLGTEFNVRAWPNDLQAATDVAVVEGTVRLAAQDNATLSIVLQAGESARLAKEDAAPIALDANLAAHAIAWRNGGFKFVGQPLGTVVQELERRYDITISLRDDKMAEKPVAVLLEKPTIEQILRDICEYNAYQYRATPEGFEIYQADVE